MEFLKQWTAFVCVTVMVSVILSFVTPKGNLGRYYKTIISLFVFMSFLLPFTQSSINFKMSEMNISNTNSITDNMVENKIKNVLVSNDIDSCNVKCTSNINANNEIFIDEIVVSIPDEYSVDKVRELIFNELSLNVEVVHIGE